MNKEGRKKREKMKNAKGRKIYNGRKGRKREN